MCLRLCPSFCPAWTNQPVRWWWEEPVDIWAAVVEIVETIGWHGSKYKIGAALTAECTYMWTDRSFNHFYSACTTVALIGCLSHTTVKNKINYLHHTPNKWIEIRLVFGQVTVQDACFSCWLCTSQFWGWVIRIFSCPKGVSAWRGLYHAMPEPVCASFHTCFTWLLAFFPFMSSDSENWYKRELAWLHSMTVWTRWLIRGSCVLSQRCVLEFEHLWSVVRGAWRQRVMCRQSCNNGILSFS